MTVKSYEVICDSCGASDVNSDPMRSVPDDWADVNIGGRGPDGSGLSQVTSNLYAHLCPRCLGMPFGEVVQAVAETMGAKYGRTVGG